ncbi:unnamed protein product [Penicillium glandicola]
MKFTWATTLLLLSTRVASLTIPQTELTDLIERDVDSLDSLDSIQDTSDIINLEKRRGGGGGRTGSSGSSSSSSSGGSSGGRTGSSSSGSSGSSSSSGRSGSSSNVGGTTSAGSGTRATYGGGSYYAGGSRTPYKSGSRSTGGISPYVLGGAALGFFPGLWLYSVYAYPYSSHYNYYNNDHKNESLPIVCLCQEYSECGCDNNTNSTYYESLFNGTVPKNSSVVRVVDVNGTQTIYINGTLANGTTAADGSSTTSSASGPVAMVLHASGYWVTVAVVVAAVWGQHGSTWLVDDEP